MVVSDNEFQDEGGQQIQTYKHECVDNNARSTMASLEKQKGSTCNCPLETCMSIFIKYQKKLHVEEQIDKDGISHIIPI